MDDRETRAEASPWHPGERALQRSAGVAERVAPLGRNIRDHLIAQHQAFFPHLPFLVAGSVDPAGAVWATLIAGGPGFLSVPDSRTLAVAAARVPADPAEAGLEDGQAVGLLGIDLHTRRRNRLNGILHRAGREGFTVAVRESFGNCPRYIRPREIRRAREPATGPAPERLEALDDAARALIGAAETLFVASAVGSAERRQVDVSHRGGPAGFVRTGSDGTLTIPDFAGNGYFNTLGNIRFNPQAGLMFVDFARGDLLQLSGEAEVVLDGPCVAAFPGAERLLRFQPRRMVRRRDVLPLRWDDLPEGAPRARAQADG